MNKVLLNFILIGRSGSGKGTQAALIKEYLEKRDGIGSVFYVYTGEILRSLIKYYPKKEIGIFLDKKVMKKGDKAPDFSAIWCWANQFMFNLDKKQHLILDGSPRTVLEARALDEFFVFYERSNVFPILVNVSAEEVKNRMLERKRADDTEEQIKHRLEYYEKYVAPITDYYKKESKNKLIDIDGNPHDVNLIHQNILKALELS